MTLPRPLLAELEACARSRLGQAFCITTVSPVSGGDINTALCLAGPTGKAFVKLRPAADAPMFAAEAEGLAALAACDAIHVPSVLGHGECAGQTWLLLEWLDLAPLRAPDDARRAGQALAALHRHSASQFGWARDNFIGSTLQNNVESERWPRFFAEQRLRPQFALAAQQGFGGELQRHGERICEHISAFFLDHHPAPSLLHGDLWSGNIAVLADGSPVLFDPACYNGDREADVAMTELFGGFPLAFYAAYREAWPLDPGFEQRKPLYNLYHILNHLNLFGAGYLGQAERMSAQLARSLGR